jgi:hypothetical protein
MRETWQQVRKEKKTHSTNTRSSTSQTNSVNSLTNTNGNIQLFILFIQCNEELWVHGRNEPEQHPVVVFENDCGLAFATRREAGIRRAEQDRDLEVEQLQGDDVMSGREREEANGQLNGGRRKEW